MQAPPILPRLRPSVFHRAASASAFTPLLYFGLHFFTLGSLAGAGPETRMAATRIIDAAVLILAAAGIGLGIFALCGIPRHGKKGLLGKALVGILVPLGLLLLIIPMAFLKPPMPPPH